MLRGQGTVVERNETPHCFKSTSALRERRHMLESCLFICDGSADEAKILDVPNGVLP